METPTKKKFRTSKDLTHQDLIKEALYGPMGDGTKEMFAGSIYERVKDQADRFGVFAPSWPAFIDALRSLPFVERIYQNPSNQYEDPIVVLKV